MSSFSRYSIFLLLLSTAVLVGIGLVMLASTSPWVEPEHLKYSHLKKQLIFLGLGVFASIAAGFTPLKFLEKFCWIIFVIACVLLTLCYVPGIQKVVNGSARWIKMPLLGQFQPSELAKIACVITMATWMTRHQANPKSFFKGYFWPLVILALPAGLIFRETDMGTTAVVIGSAFLLLYAAGSRPSYLIITGIAGLVFLYMYVVMEIDGGNRAERLLAFTDLEGTKLGYGLQQWRALLAFASGGAEGVGLGNGAEKHGYLPFAHTDFIFPIIGEELGLVATLGVTLAYVLISFAGVLIASRSHTYFGSLLAIGLTANIVIPAIMNIGVTTAMLPNTGLPLPFVSYGGTNLIFTLISVGILAGIYFRSPHEVKAVVTTKRNRRIIRL